MFQARYRISFFLIAALWGCGEDFSGGKRFIEPPQREEIVVFPPENFSSRLSNALLISGTQCRGNETTQAYGRGANCLAGQYLITVDNVNTCSAAGICTNYFVIPIVAELEDFDARIPDHSLFEIIPKSVATAAQKDILENIILQTDSSGNSTIILRD